MSFARSSTKTPSPPRLNPYLPNLMSLLYTKHTTPPEITDTQKWTGNCPLPAIGDRVKITANGWGLVTVRGYFTEGGWIGLLVEPDRAPDWYLNQYKDKIKAGEIKSLLTVHVFGREVVPDSTPTPSITIGHQLALAVVKAKFRNWRVVLNEVWMNGVYGKFDLGEISSLLQQLRNMDEGFDFAYGRKSRA